MTKREFIEQYILNAARGAGALALNIDAAISEAERAWRLMQERAAVTRIKWSKP